MRAQNAPSFENGRTIFIADADRDDRQCFIVRADEKLTAFMELESAILASETQKRLQVCGDCKLCGADAEHDSRFDLDKSVGFLGNCLKQDLNPGDGASPDSFFPFSDLQSQN